MTNGMSSTKPLRAKPGGSAPLFESLVSQALVNAEDAADARLYLAEQTALRKWKPNTLERQYQCISPLLKHICATTGSLAKLTRSDAIALITYLQNHPTWSEASRPKNWDRFITFYRWVHKRRGQEWDKAAFEVLGGDAKYHYKLDENKITPKDIFTAAEVLELVAAENILQFKALWIVGFEGGLRIGEAKALRIRDVQRGSEGSFTLHLPQSKTVKRTIPLELYSPQVLAKWLALHPQQSNENAPLFVNTLGNPIDYAQTNKQLRSIVRRTGMKGKSKVSFHCLRHSRATELASMMTEQQLCVFFGWTIGSKQVRTYVRAGAIDIRQAIRRGYGLEKIEEAKEQGKKCLQCQHLNAYSAEYCDNCNLPLDAKRLSQIKQNVDGLRMESMLKEMMAKEFRSLIDETKKEMTRQDSPVVGTKAKA